MTCAVCPNCGLDLEKFAPQQIGDLDLQVHEIKWKDRRVPLTHSERMVVTAIARANGLPIANRALAEIVGCDERKTPHNIVAIYVHRARKSFRAIDPGFDAIKTVFQEGFMWSPGGASHAA